MATIREEIGGRFQVNLTRVRDMSDKSFSPKCDLRSRAEFKTMIEELDPYEQTLVEFVHTMAPSATEPAHDEA